MSLTEGRIWGLPVSIVATAGEKPERIQPISAGAGESRALAYFVCVGYEVPYCWRRTHIW
jgi:hypothetical protein